MKMGLLPMHVKIDFLKSIRQRMCCIIHDVCFTSIKYTVETVVNNDMQQVTNVDWSTSILLWEINQLAKSIVGECIYAVYMWRVYKNMNL